MKSKSTFLYNLILFCTVLGLTSNNLHAQTFVDASATGNNDGTSWQHAYTDLSIALDHTSSGEIWVAGGTYKPGDANPDTLSTFRISTTLELYGGFNGTETGIDQRDIQANPTILSGDILGDDEENDQLVNRTDNVIHVVLVDSMNMDRVVIDGFSIKNGHTRTDFSLDFSLRAGAGIFTYSPVTIRNCQFTENFGRSGASIAITQYSTGGGDESVIEDCVFENNYGTAQSAGIFMQRVNAVHVGNCIFRENKTNRGALYPAECTDITIVDCDFIDNTNVDTVGGFTSGYFGWQNLGIQMNECEFRGNLATSAAAVYEDGRDVTPAPENLIMTGCTFAENRAYNGFGGAIYGFSAGFTIDDCIFSDNTNVNMNGEANGGHIFNSGANQDVMVNHSSFEGGLSEFGGGHAFFGENSSLTLDNNTYTQNEGSTSGGALIIGFGALATINNCSFIDNDARFGAGLFLQSDGTIVTFNDCNFEDNNSAIAGGAVDFLFGVAGELNNCYFENNISGIGGAITASNPEQSSAANLTINSCVFESNNARQQAGAVNLSDYNTNIINTVFSNNEAENNDPMTPSIGGAISNNALSGTDMVVFIINSTFVDNLAELGAGIAQWTENDIDAGCELRLQNNLFFDLDASYEVESGSPTVVSLGGNLIGDMSLASDLTHPKDQNEVFSRVFADRDNGDYHLFNDSPALDAGVAENAPTMDSEGFSRVREIDAGAFEFQGNPLSLQKPVQNDGQLKLFPNPVITLATLQLKNEWTGDLELRVFNLLGQTVKSMSLTKSGELLEQAVNLAELRTGNYRLVLSNSNSSIHLPFTKID